MLDHLHADQVIALFELHAADAARRTAHGADVVFLEAAGHAFVRAQEDVILAAGEAGGQQFIALVQTQGDDAARHDVVELGQLALLDDALLGDHHDELAGDEFLHRQERGDGFVRLKIDQAGACLPLPTVAASGIS